ncbi:alpha/beta hydrolase [Nocardia sp. NPDC005366]|uniref:alpha/beta hydrolase n=1 Tax=Nocardia sp. NPDC005366 TaxID=3156878 RepID=UPI0033BBB7A6
MTDSDVAITPQIGPPVPFDPELAAALEVILPHMPNFTSVDAIPAIRARAGELMVSRSNEELSRDGAFHVEEILVPGVHGEQISLMVCRPTGIQAPSAAIYYIHGGGMIIGSNRMISDDMLDWATEFDATLISVDYRLAPETPHPGPMEDCYAGLVWVADHAGELGIDPARIVIAGESAGGGLAAATALLARDRQGPAIAAQVLMCPMLDDRNDTPSAIQSEGRGVWHRHANETGWSALLGAARGGPDVSPYAAPARATDLSGLPPALIDVGSAETFRDEAVTYASNIWRAGGQAELHVFAGGFHRYDGLAPQTTVSRDTKDVRVRWLRRIMNS